MRLVQACAVSASLASVVFSAEIPSLLPVPKRIAARGGRVRIAQIRCVSDHAPAIRQGLAHLRARVAGLAPRGLPSNDDGPALWLGTRADLPKLSNLLRREATPPDEMCRPDGYWIHCAKANGRDVVVCLGYDQRGCYYGIQTLIQLLRKDGDRVSIPRVEIVDWPSFRVRLVKNSASRGDPRVVEMLARTLPQYKINVYALQFHGSRRSGTWREPSERYVTNIRTVGRIARDTGVLEPALFLCPFFRPKIDTSKQEDVDVYVERLRWGLRQGFRWVEVDFNDWGTWETLNEAERAKFRDLGEYMAHLTNAAYRGVRKEFPDAGVIVCPTTRWYRGHAKPELITLCKLIPEDVLVYWTGPVTRSRYITDRHIQDWAKATGRKPFLWDNTIYAHFQPYWVGYALNPFWNSFPKNLPDLLEGGIHLNSSATELYLPGMMTFADYAWNPEAYDPERSIRTALRLCWGDEGGAVAQEVRANLGIVLGMLRESNAGIRTFDKAAALRAVHKITESVKRFGKVTGREGLAGAMDRAIVANARKAVQQFEPPKAVAKGGRYVRKPLADGVINGGAEEVADGKPVNWCLYTGGARAMVTASADAHTGKYSACLEAVKWYHNPKHAKHGPRKWLNVALMHGGEGRGGYDGWQAYDVLPNKAYRCTFWLKGDVPVVSLFAQGWRMGFTAKHRVGLDAYPASVEPTMAWKQYSFSFRTSFVTSKAAIKFGLLGYEHAGARLGKIWVDDLTIEEE